MKTIIIAVSAAAFVAAAPDAMAQSTSVATHHKIQARHHSALAGHPSGRGMQTSYPNAFGYAPVQPQRLDREIESSRQAGGGGGGGGSGM